MFERLREYWLPCALFLATLGSAGALAGLVAIAPLLTFEGKPFSKLIGLFANDFVVRRTAIGAAVGLAVTAFVFFRPKGFFFARKPRSHATPDQIAGA
ncbi:MAG: hypothetical protein HY040_23600 [Planctomycetes bacterium]|nr:hypothetical protein [Planctomycetota bacterium]